MNRKLLIFCLLAPLAVMVAAKPVSEVKTAATDSCRSTFLMLHGGLGYTTWLDQGVSPVRYAGAVAMPGVDFRFNGPRMLWQVDAEAGAAAAEPARPPLFDINAFQGIFLLSGQALLRSRNHSWLAYGLGVDQTLLVSNTSSFQNASTALHNSLALTLDAQVRLPLGRWQISLDATLSPVALTLGPGYAYLDNYSAANTDTWQTFLDQYQHRVQSLSTLNTQLCLTRPLATGNQLSFCYTWRYRTMQNNYYWAQHLIGLSLHFGLTRKPATSL